MDINTYRRSTIGLSHMEEDICDRTQKQEVIFGMEDDEINLEAPTTYVPECTYKKTLSWIQKITGLLQRAQRNLYGVRWVKLLSMEAKERHHDTVMVMRQKQTSLTLNTVTEPLRSIAQPILSSSCQKWASIAARNTLTQTGVTVVVFPRKDCSMSTIRQGTTNWNASALTPTKGGKENRTTS